MRQAQRLRALTQPREHGPCRLEPCDRQGLGQARRAPRTPRRSPAPRPDTPSPRRRPVAPSVLRPRMAGSVRVDMTKVPGLAGANRQPAPHARHAARRDRRSQVAPQPPMATAIAPDGRRGHFGATPFESGEGNATPGSPFGGSSVKGNRPPPSRSAACFRPRKLVADGGELVVDAGCDVGGGDAVGGRLEERLLDVEREPAVACASGGKVRQEEPSKGSVARRGGRDDPCLGSPRLCPCRFGRRPFGCEAPRQALAIVAEVGNGGPIRPNCSRSFLARVGAMVDARRGGGRTTPLWQLGGQDGRRESRQALLDGHETTTSPLALRSSPNHAA